MPQDSPWGPVQFIKEIVPGIEFLGTAIHGGFRLSAARLAEMPECLKISSSFYAPGGTHFEEDIEYSRVILSFPGLFSETEVKTARRILQYKLPHVHKEYVDYLGRCMLVEGSLLSDEEMACFNE